MSSIPEDAIDIGLGHWIRRVEWEGEPAAIDDFHLRPDGSVCSGFIPFRGTAYSKLFEGSPNYQAWDVLSAEPLTLSPSLLCRVCGDHGYITNGRWVKAA